MQPPPLVRGCREKASPENPFVVGYSLYPRKSSQDGGCFFLHGLKLILLPTIVQRNSPFKHMCAYAIKS